MTGVSVSLLAGSRVPHVAARFGVKGADGSRWLADLGIPMPPAPNRASHWPQGRCLRLGSSEYLVELDAADARQPADPAAADGSAQAWLLLRNDHCLLLDEYWPPVLAQACSFDFARFHDEPALVVMTLLAGISVTLAREPAPGAGLTLRLWCDASYAIYLDQVLHQLAASHAAGDPQR